MPSQGLHDVREAYCILHCYIQQGYVQHGTCISQVLCPQAGLTNKAGHPGQAALGSLLIDFKGRSDAHSEPLEHDNVPRLTQHA